MNFDKLAIHFGFTRAELYTLLHKVNGYIIGGSALSIFLNEDLHPEQDMDIFIPCKYKIYYANGEQKYMHEWKIDDIGQLLEEKGYYESGTVSGNVPNHGKYNKINYYIDSTRNFKFGAVEIQVVMLYVNIDDFFDTIDLNICKLAIYPKPLYGLAFYHDYHPYISIYELKCIKQKQMYIVGLLNSANLCSRIEKIRKTWIYINEKAQYTRREQYLWTNNIISNTRCIRAV